MTFPDVSVIIDMLAGVTAIDKTVEERGQSYRTSAICVFEVVDEKGGSGRTDVVWIRLQFGGVRALDLNEQIELDAARMQEKLMDDGERMAPRDLLIAVMARSTGDDHIVADGAFETELLSAMIDVANLRRDD